MSSQLKVKSEPIPEHAKADWKLARRLVEPLYGDQTLRTGESRLAHADGMAEILREIRDDEELLTSAYLFCIEDCFPSAEEWVVSHFGSTVWQLVRDLERIVNVSRKSLTETREAGAVYQSEAVRRMMLAMCTDLRVVLLRLASRLQTLRYFAHSQAEGSDVYARETLAVYAPLANRLGIWQMKWELEDLSLRFAKPKEYAEISRLLDQSRQERLDFMQACVERIRMLLTAHGIDADVSGRPKHIYSIYKKMQRKHLRFDQLFDIRATRIIVDSVERCYEVLSIIQENFTVLNKEYDDYIANPKPNGYQSLHTVITAPSGVPVEVQIRTRQMHEFAELGVAAHWRYKETGNSNKDKGAEAEEQRVAWLRRLLEWKNDVVDNQPEVGEAVKDDHVYALTPQGRVVELPHGATPIDFAYYLHTELGHRCRGAKVNGAMVSLNTPLKTGETVEIITAKQGGPSRDWLNPELGFAVSPRTRTKVRQWFNAQTLAQQTAAGRERLDKELARLGKTAFKLEDLAKRLGYANVDDLCVAFAKEEFSLRALEAAVLPQELEEEHEDDIVIRQANNRPESKSGSNILVVGVDSLMTQLARCCHPAPPDEIVGFVTRGRGVTIHRFDCPNIKNLTAADHERIIEVSWGNIPKDAVYPVDVYIVARDRQGLIKEISEVLMREKHNIIGINTMSVKGDAHMRFSIQVHSSEDIRRILSQMREIKGVLSARRA